MDFVYKIELKLNDKPFVLFGEISVLEMDNENGHSVHLIGDKMYLVVK